MSGTYTYNALANKYKNFHTPAFKIKIGGKDVVSSMKLAIENLSVDISMGSASACSFSIANAYDIEKRAFDKSIKSKLALGSVVEVELGYLSVTTLVFKGYITNVGVEYGGPPSLSITAMDVRRLMMDGKERNIKHDVKNYSDAFMEVMKRYEKLSPSPKVDKTDEKLESVYQRSSDYDFIKKIARLADREFFVIAGKTYFRIPRSSTRSIMTLEWGKDLQSFSRDLFYQVIDVQVIGYDEEKKEAVVGTAREKSDGSIKEVISQSQPTVISDPMATDLKKAKKRAEAEAKKQKHKAQSGNGSCIGLPEIVPGRFITLKKLDPSIDGDYYITSVRHSVGTDGFSTSFRVGGWK